MVSVRTATVKVKNKRKKEWRSIEVIGDQKKDQRAHRYAHGHMQACMPHTDLYVSMHTHAHAYAQIVHTPCSIKLTT